MVLVYLDLLSFVGFNTFSTFASGESVALGIFNPVYRTLYCHVIHQYSLH
jgi:hypothetical protein